MKTITEYQCEICSKKYDTAKEATECEAKGVFNFDNFPVGLMKCYVHNGYVGIFAMASHKLLSHNPHHANDSYWACRVNGNDSLDKRTCGSGLLPSIETFIKHYYIPDEYIECAEFKRMVYYLRTKNITPQYYNPKGELVKL